MLRDEKNQGCKIGSTRESWYFKWRDKKNFTVTVTFKQHF